jgi:phage-related minor tail protein
MSLGQLGVEVYASTARLEGDMGRAAQIVESRARAMDQAAVKARKSIESIGDVRIGRVNGIREAANEMEHLSHTTVGARREMLVLAHELVTGNFKRAAGSVMVLGERMDWMSKIMSPTGAAIGIVVGALAVLTAALIKGAAESTAFAHTIQLTGNYAGVTEGQFNEMAHNIAASSGATIGNAREIAQAFVQGGRLSGAALESASVAAAKLSVLTGEKSETIVRSMEKMADGVDKWAMEANKQYHFVDAALYEHIRVLEEQGRTEQAEMLALDALNKHLGDLDKNLGYLESAWKGVKDAASGAWDAMLSWGRKKTVDDQLADAEKEVNRIHGAMQSSTGAMNADIYGKQLQDALTRVNELTKQKMREQDNALLEQQKSDHATRSAEDQQFYDNLIKETRTREQERADAIRDINRRADESGWTPAMRAKAISAANEKYKDRGAAAGARADLGADLKPLEDSIADASKLLTQQEQTLQRFYRDNKLSIADYYADQETIIKAHSKVVGDAYDKEITTLTRYANTTKDHAAKVEALTKANDLANKKEQALQADREKLALNTEAMAKDTDNYREAVEKLAAELAKQQGRAGETAGAEFDREKRSVIDRARAQGDTGTLGIIDQLRANAEAQQRMNDLKVQAEAVEKALNLQVETTNDRVKAGQEGELQGLVDLDNERATAAKRLADIAARMQDIAAASGVVALQQEANQWSRTAQQMSAQTDALGRKFDDVFSSAFSRFMDNAVTGTKTLKQNFLDMANSIEQAITRLVANDLAQQLFGLGGNGNGGGMFSALFQLIGLTGGGGGGGGSFNFSMPSGGGGGGATQGVSALMGLFDLLPGMAAGGPVGAGSLHEVNERGPELLTVANRTFLMMGSETGRVTPMSGSDGGSQNVFHMNIAVPPGTTRQSAQQQAAEIMRHAQLAMARNG